MVDVNVPDLTKIKIEKTSLQLIRFPSPCMLLLKYPKFKDIKIQVPEYKNAELRELFPRKFKSELKGPTPHF
jgi:hypothetical protein